MAEDARLVRDGEDCKGIASRWCPGTLRDRILDIHGIRDRLSFIEGDGLGVIGRDLAWVDGTAPVVPKPVVGPGGRMLATRAA